MRNDPEILKYIENKKWKYKTEGSQYRIESCVYCGDSSYRFYVNKITGQFQCFKCNARGNMFTLKKHLGEIAPVTSVFKKSTISLKREKKYYKRCLKYCSNLKGNLKVRRYLYGKWGYTLKDIKTFKLGFMVDDDNNSWLSIPCFNVDNRLINIKFRTIMTDKKSFSRIKGMESSLFNINNLDMSLNYAYVCEGESDTVTGYTKFGLNVVGVTVGARGFKSEWKDVLDTFEIIYIIYDSDVPGQQGAHKLAERIGIHKCKNVLIPNVKDLTEFWKNFKSREYFNVIRDRSKYFNVKDVISIKDVLTTLKSNLLQDDALDIGLETPWKKVNKLIGSLVAGDLIIVSGQAKVGKTTFALNVSLYNSLLLSIPTLYYCLEMRPERTITKVISFLRLIPRSEINVDDLDVVHSLFGKKPLYLAHSYDFTPDMVFETIKSSVKRYGIELLIFDHLHYLVRSISNPASEVSHTVRRFKLFAEELKIPIILIAQPRKLSGKSSRMTVHDLRDSSSIGQDGDTIIILHRDRLYQGVKGRGSGKAIFSDTTEVIVEATRYNPGGICELKFNGLLSRYFTDKREERKVLSLRSKRSKMVYIFD